MPVLKKYSRWFMTHGPVGFKNNRWPLFMAVLAVAFLCLPQVGLTAPVVLDESLSTIYLGTEVEFLEDPDRSLNLTDVMRADMSWNTSERIALNFGITSSAYWFRFSIDNVMAQAREWYLELLFPHMKNINVYVLKDGNIVRTVQAGLDHPFSQRDVPDKNFVFTFNQPPGKQSYYMRIAADTPLIVEPVMLSRSAYREKFSKVYPIFWIYYGAVLIMIVYNLILFFLVREINIIYLVVFIASLMLLQLTVDGFAFQYLWPNSVWWDNNCMIVLLCLMMASMVVFMREFINLPELLPPKYNKLWVYTVIWPNIIWPLICLLVGVNTSMLYVTGVLTGYSVAAVVAVGVICLVKRKITRAVRFTWLSFSPLLPAAALIACNAIGVLPTNFFTTWSIHIAVVIFIALLSVGLADKLTALKNELLASNANISLMLQSISQDADNNTANLEDCREEEIGRLLQTRFHNFTQKFKELVGAVRHNADILNDSSTGLFGLSDRMTVETGEMTARAESVASASEQMSANMTTIAGAMEQTDQSVNLIASSTEQMTGTVHEVTTSTEAARKTTANAVSQSKKVSARVDELGGAAEKIGMITETITEISKKTNLLALNATIEAARAGDAGQGFAVVAGEIKALASQTAVATHQINKQIEGNQAITGEAVGEIRRITEVINRVDEIVATIASSVEEQFASTREVAGNVTQISQGVSETNQSVTQCSDVANAVSRDVAALSGASRQMNGNSLKIKESAAELSRIADGLADLMKKFQV